MKACPSDSVPSCFPSPPRPLIFSFLMRPATPFGSPISTAAAPSCLSSTSWTEHPADASNYVSCGTTGRPSTSTASRCWASIPAARAAIRSLKALTSFRFRCWLTREERSLLATVRAGFLSNGRSTVSASTGEFGLRSAACRLPRGSWRPSPTLPSASNNKLSLIRLCSSRRGGARFQRAVPAFLPASHRPAEGPAHQRDMSPGMATPLREACATAFDPDISECIVTSSPGQSPS